VQVGARLYRNGCCVCAPVLGPYDAEWGAALAEEAGLPGDVQVGARCCQMF
jgi:hypothetical protein